MHLAETRTRGFTLVESMVVLSITSILAIAAAPSFADFIAGQRVKTAAFDLFSDLVYARSTAIQTNSEVIIAQSAGGWSAGWKITWVDKGGVTRTLRKYETPVGALALTGSTGQLGFQRNGRPLAGTPAVQFTLDDGGGRAGVPPRCVQIDAGGRPNSLVGACS